MTAITCQERVARIDRANEIRLLRADTHNRIRRLSRHHGREAVARLLEEQPWWLESAFVDVVLRWADHVGAYEAQTMLNRISCRYGRHSIAELTDRQRTLLADLLRGQR